MNKKLAILVAAVMAVTLLLGACTVERAQDTATPGPIPDNDKVIVVAQVNGQPIYRDEYLRILDDLANQYGIDASDAQMAGLLQEMAIESMLYEKAMLVGIEERGYMDLTEQELADVDEMIQDLIDTYLSYYMPDIEAELGEGYTSEQYADKLAEYEAMYFSEINMTREDVREYFINKIAVDHAMEALVGNVLPTEQQVQDQYDAKLESDKTLIDEQPANYDLLIQQGETPYYVPAGMRRVRHVVVSLGDEALGMMMGYRMEGEDEKADALIAEKLPGIKPEAQEALDKLQAGEITFDEAIETYGDDPGSESEPEGYLVYEGCGTWMPEFTEGAMSLENVGDITGLIQTDYGYHIIEYTSEVEAGAVPYEQVHDAIYDELEPTLQQQAWVEMVTAWKADMDIEIFREEL